MDFTTIKSLYDLGSNFGLNIGRRVVLSTLFYKWETSPLGRQKDFWEKVIVNFVVFQDEKPPEKPSPSLPCNVYLQECERKWVLWALRMPGHLEPPSEIIDFFDQLYGSSVDPLSEEDVKPQCAEVCECNVDGGFFGECVHGFDFTPADGECCCGELQDLLETTLVGYCCHGLLWNRDLLPGLAAITDDEWEEDLDGLVLQGNTVTNIFGSNNRVTSSTGANGWTPTVSTNVSDGAITSSTAPPAAGGVTGGSSHLKPMMQGNGMDPGLTIDSSGIGLRIPHNWWNSGKTNSTISSAAPESVKARWKQKQEDADEYWEDDIRQWAKDAADGKIKPGVDAAANLATVVPSEMRKGNATIQTGSAAHCLMALPPTKPVVLPNPDAPSAPGPSADRTWLVDSFQWTPENTVNTWLGGPNAMIGSNWKTPMENPANFAGPNGQGYYYPLPASMVHAHPQSTWAAMYNTHSLWNCGWRAQITVNASQFHAGALAVFMCPELGNGGYNYATMNMFIFPYTILNLYESNTASIEVPYCGPTPNISAGIHCPWTVVVAVISPLRVPGGSPNSLTVNLYITPIRSTFHGLRQPRQQHLKFRSVPGSGAFGTVVAGQEIPICGIVPEAPPDEYIPGEVYDWLEYARRPTCMTTIVWTTAEETGDQLSIIPLNPVTIASNTSALAAVTSLFSQWRGSINIHLLFTGATQMYGRLVIAYTPPGFDPPSNVQEAMVGTYKVWDINSAPSMQFTAPFISSAYWKTVDAYNTEGPLGSSGWVTLWVQNPLQDPGPTPASCDILVFVAAADDFQLRLQQNPVFGFQAEDNTIGGGQPETAPTAVDTFHYPTHHGLPDTVLSTFFSFYRDFWLDNNNITFGEPTLVNLTPATNNTSVLQQLLSAFTYFKADLRIACSFTGSFQQPFTINIGYIPPGATLTSAVNVQDLSNFFMVSQTLTAEATICLSVPYNCPLSAMMVQFCGWENYSGQNFGQLMSNTFGALVIFPQKSVYESPETLNMNVYIAFGDFKAWLPRPLPIPGSPPTLEAQPSHQAGEEEVEVPERAFLVRNQKAQYVHWALRSEKGQISLSSVHGQAVVAWENEEGEIVEEVDPLKFVILEQMVGHPYRYNCVRNCSTLIGDLLGKKLENTGTGLACALAATAATVAVVGVKTAVATTRQGITDSLATAAETATRLKSAADTVKGLNLEESSKNLLAAARTLELPVSTGNLKDTAKMMTTSIDGLREAVESFRTGKSEGVTSFVNQVISVILKIIGYVMVVFGSPTPLSIAGLVTIILADSFPAVVKFFTNCESVFGSIFYCVGRKLGLSVTPEEAVQASAPLEEAVTQIEPQGVRDFNEAMNALKNTDWLITKILMVIEKVLEWLGLKVKEDVKLKISEHHDEVCELYSDSLTAQGALAVNKEALQENIKKTRELLRKYTNWQSPTHTTMLTQSLKNYLAVQNRDVAESPRPEPVVIYLYGKPGCGKSVLANLLAAQLAQILSGDPSDVYSTVDPKCQYFDGYTGQVCHLMDDIGQDPDGDDWANFPNLVCSSPFVVPMAELTQKGKHYSSRVIIATSNFSGPTQSAVRSVAAIERRLHFRIEVSHEGPLDVTKQLSADGPQTKHFAADCPLLRLEDVKLKVSPYSKHECGEIKHLDDLIDMVLARVNHSNRTNQMFSHLIKQGINSSTQTPFEQAVKSNAPLSVIEKIWAYRKPIFCMTTMLTVITSFVGLFSLARRFLKSQGAYSGIGGKTKDKKKQVQQLKHGLHRQGLPAEIGTIMGNVEPVKVYYGECGPSMAQVTWLFKRTCVTVGHILEDPKYGEWTHMDIGRLRVTPNNCQIVLKEELAYITVDKGPEHKDLRRFLTQNEQKEGFLVAHPSGYQTLLKFWDARKTSVYRNGINMENAVGYRCSSFVGLCGAPLIYVQKNVAKIGGFHTAGVVGHSGFSQIWDEGIIQQSIRLELERTQTSHVTRRSRIQPSPLIGVFPIVKEPAVLSKHDPRLGEGVDFDVVVTSKHGRGDVTEPWPNLEAAFEYYFQRVPHVRTLSMLEAINGTPLLDGIDMSQSPGHPWNQYSSRRELFDETENGWVPKPHLEEAIKRQLQNPDYWYMSSLKDELRPCDKVEAGKTRIIEAAPIDAIIAGRMVFGGLFEEFQRQPGEFGSAVGCDPDVDWTKFYHDFLPYGQVYDLDYSNYDSTVPSICFKLLAQHLEEKIQHDSVIPYLMSICESKHVFGKQNFMTVGGMPSGCVGTSIFNTIINNCVLLSAMMSHKDFNLDYRILAYGDDVLYATEPPIHPNFIKEFYDKHTNFQVTPVLKGGDFAASSDLSTVTFLKRWFEPDDKRPYYIHPVIRPDVYESSVMWIRDGTLQEVVDSCANLAFHAGPKNYRNWACKILERSEELKLGLVVPPYDFLQNRWISKVQQ